MMCLALSSTTDASPREGFMHNIKMGETLGIMEDGTMSIITCSVAVST